jgi:cbb3-type cytochrome oxidase subunit 1
MWSQYAGIIASVGVHIVVYTVVFNIVATMASDWRQVLQSTELKFLLAGVFCYLITCIQCAFQVTLSVQTIIHFTDWVVGHSHFVLFGVFSFWCFAWIYYLLPRILQTPIYSESMKTWHFWLSFLGIVIMQFDLLSAGLVQGWMWKSMAPFIDSVAASVPFWWVRAFSGMVIFVGETLFVINVFMTFIQSRQKSSVKSAFVPA